MNMNNLITHFTNCHSFVEILKSNHFVSFYNKEEITNEMKDESNESSKFLIPMVCFCDTDVNLSNHIGVYGDIGISFTKEWAIKKGLIPVMYIHRFTKIKSKLQSLFLEVASKYSKANSEEREIILETHKELFTISLFMKPYEGYFEKTKSVQCYYFEREWRFIPELEKQVDYGENKVIIKEINKNIKNDDRYFLSFGINEIAKIITTKKNNDKLINFLNSNNFESLLDKVEIIS